MVFSDILGFYPLCTDATFALQVANKNVPRHYQMYSGDKITPAPVLDSHYVIIFFSGKNMHVTLRPLSHGPRVKCKQIHSPDKHIMCISDYKANFLTQKPFHRTKIPQTFHIPDTFSITLFWTWKKCLEKGIISLEWRHWVRAGGKDGLGGLRMPPDSIRRKRGDRNSPAQAWPLLLKLWLQHWKC